MESLTKYKKKFPSNEKSQYISTYLTSSHASLIDGKMIDYGNAFRLGEKVKDLK